MLISRRAFSGLLLTTASAALLGGRGVASTILSRSDWGAAPATQRMLRHAPVRITIHHTAVRANPKVSLGSKLRSLQRFSQSEERLADGRMKKAWADLPYHFFIGAAGQVAEGRAVSYVGDTNTSYDPKGHIGIALEGSFNVEAPTSAQIDALVDLVKHLSKTYAIGPEHIGTHGDYAATACPGDNMVRLLPEVLMRAFG